MISPRLGFNSGSKRFTLHTSLLICEVLLVLLLTACYGSQRRQMLALLDEADSLNRAYAQLPSDTLLAAAADFFDRHGTPNEQVRAHYLLGCAYRDMGEAPQALQCFLDAVDRADTLNKDCNYALLCRVYAQMAGICYEQNLMEYSLRALDLSIVSAEKAQDTVVAINALAHKMGAYERMVMTDSVIAISDYLYDDIYVGLHRKDVAKYFGTSIKSYLLRQDTAKARKMIDAYERESGFFDSCQNIERGREAYYFLKGKYFQSIGKLDSAEYFFRKELVQGKDLVNQDMASRALSLLFSRRNQPDSTAKYALYSYTMNDSAYNNMVTREMEHVKGLYDYSRFSRLAYEEKQNADKSRRQAHYLLILFVNALLLAAALWYWQSTKRKIEQKKYNQTLRMLTWTKKDLERLREQIPHLKSHEAELCQMIAEKEQELKTLREDLAKYKSRQPELDEDMEIARMFIEDSAIYKHLQKQADRGNKLTEKQWQEIENFTAKTLKQFHECITAKTYELSKNEIRMCVLLRLYVKPKAASHLLDVSPSFVTKQSKSVLWRIYKVDGTAKNLIDRLVQLC
jgi:hypothetical protein